MSARGTILLVEDEAIIALAQARDVHAEGYSVIIAGSGAEAIAKVEEEGSAIDLVLMDIDLGPGMDGTEAAQEILKRRDLPVVFLSSHMERGVVERTERITSYGYVRKGSGIMALSASIKMAFKLWDAHRSIDEKNRRIEAASEQLIRSWNEIVGREEALARSEARFRSMVENGADAFTLVDSEGKVSYEGPTVERLTGYAPEERAGASGFDNVHPDDLPAARAAMGRVMAVPDASASLEFRSIRKDGTVWWTQGTR
jgi:PAS domain S-box-containing protein